MKLSIVKGLSYGLTSGVITTLGLMVGLHSSTNSKLAVVGGIFVIAVADSMSDALGMHISEESASQLTTKGVWESTLYTFISKFIVASTFLVPILLLDFTMAINISIVWGLSLITVLSWVMAKQQNTKTWHVISEHLLITVGVIAITHYLGDWIGKIFGSV
jgi:VIT1/CCC1 family predicted Fe2+/Mn2+ transporter